MTTAGTAQPPRAARLPFATLWLRVGTRFLPFADAATPELPLGRLLRLALFQISVGMAMVLLNGTLNRVMIVELGVPATVVAIMVSLPLVFAPFRALIGFRSDNHRSVLGWRRVPYIWMGTLLQFGGLAIMPFALIVLSGDTHGPVWIGTAGAGLAFILVGVGLHTTQTAGLALATDLAAPDARPRVVALLYVMLLAGMVLSSLVFGWLLGHFSQLRLIKVIQGAALLTFALNVIALWKQEARNPALTSADRERRPFGETWRDFVRGGRTSRLLVAVGVGSAAFSMQDILLEPYGGQVMHLGVSATTALTALMSGGALVAFVVAARRLARGSDPVRLSAVGLLTGVVGFAAVMLADPVESTALFRVGTALIGFGSGLFSVCMLIAAMELESGSQTGLALGAWGAVQAACGGCAIAFGGALRDGVASLASRGLLGEALAGPATGYNVVYQLEIVLLFVTLIVAGPLVRKIPGARSKAPARMGLAEFPG